MTALQSFKSLRPCVSQIETASQFDDDLMEKYLEDEDGLTGADIRSRPEGCSRARGYAVFADRPSKISESSVS